MSQKAYSFAAKEYQGFSQSNTKAEINVVQAYALCGKKLFIEKASFNFDLDAKEGEKSILRYGS
jgi:hypothetical protein